MGKNSYILIPRKSKQSRILQNTIKNYKGAIKLFFNFLVDEGFRMSNPIENLHIRGIRKTIHHNLFDFEELEDFYYSYTTENIQFPHSPSVAMRNKVIIGFMIYQGMNSTALKSLKVEHIHLNKGKVYIPSTRKANSRTLELKSNQILLLVQYLEIHRAILQEKIDNYTEALFPIKDDRFYISYTICKEIRKFNHKLTNIKQIRASVIVYWLSQYNIREVQYMAGHRYISSTERYVQENLESLQEVIESLHPIN
ncbi:Integrase/recombinase XerD family [Tenacibaculum maritimum]|nr:Integrase/recombinase XerD family [Tenacibaculum maritimum]